MLSWLALAGIGTTIGPPPLPGQHGSIVVRADNLNADMQLRGAVLVNASTAVRDYVLAAGLGVARRIQWLLRRRQLRPR